MERGEGRKGGVEEMKRGDEGREGWRGEERRRGREMRAGGGE